MSTARQLIRFGVVGATSNAVLYVLYLVMTTFGVSPLAAMTSVFVLGVACTFAFNRHYTFHHRGSVVRSGIRYASVYCAAYIASASALALLVDVVGLPHRFVMLGLIVVTAAFVFALQKLWVFSPQLVSDEVHTEPA
jgi:putative flippase GtrA